MDASSDGFLALCVVLLMGTLLFGLHSCGAWVEHVATLSAGPAPATCTCTCVENTPVLSCPAADAADAP